LQLSQQIENLNSTYKNLSYQIKNLQLQSKLQIDQLVNQLLTLNSNLKQIENSLSSYKVLSLVDGKIKSVLVAEGSKVSTSTPLIQILGKNTLKFKIFSPVLLSGNTLYFNFK
jgi:multidrug resistance efflux pump